MVDARAVVGGTTGRVGAAKLGTGVGRIAFVVAIVVFGPVNSFELGIVVGGATPAEDDDEGPATTFCCCCCLFRCCSCSLPSAGRRRTQVVPFGKT